MQTSLFVPCWKGETPYALLAGGRIYPFYQFPKKQGKADMRPDS
jgi:hypothetical protein